MDLVKVANYRTRMEADTAGAVLEGADIPFLIQSADGMGIVPPPDGATLFVRKEHLQEARRLLDNEE